MTLEHALWLEPRLMTGAHAYEAIRQQCSNLPPRIRIERAAAQVVLQTAVRETCRIA